jgi:hypothetical protein
MSEFSVYKSVKIGLAHASSHANPLLAECVEHLAKNLRRPDARNRDFLIFSAYHDGNSPSPDFHGTKSATWRSRLVFLYLGAPSRAFPSSFRIAVSRHTGRNDGVILSGARGKCAGEADKSPIEIEALGCGGGLSPALCEYRLHTLLRSSTCRPHDVLWWRRRRCCRARAKQQQTKH